MFSSFYQAQPPCLQGRRQSSPHMEKLSGAEKTGVTRRHHRGRPGAANDLMLGDLRGRPGAAQDLMLGDHRGRPGAANDLMLGDLRGRPGAAQDLMLGDQPPPGLRPSYGQDVAGHQDQLVLLDGAEARYGDFP
jgi:hypothetical protein